jgi:hypothetical protein
MRQAFRRHVWRTDPPYCTVGEIEPFTMLPAFGELTVKFGLMITFDNTPHRQEYRRSRLQIVQARIYMDCTANLDQPSVIGSTYEVRPEPAHLVALHVENLVKLVIDIDKLTSIVQHDVHILICKRVLVKERVAAGPLDARHRFL